MATVKQLQDLKKTFEKQIDKLIASISTDAADAAGEDAEAEPEKGDVKLTPIQKLEKQKETANEKLTKLNEKIAGGKSKIPDKDAENKTKLEEVISKIDEKIAESQAKEAKKAEPKPAKAVAKKAVEAEPKPAKVVAKPAPATAAVTVPETKKHVPRMTPAITVILKDAFKVVSIDWDDKYKGEFTKWVNALSEKEFDEMKLEGHASTFANAQSPPAAGGGGTVVKALKVSDLQKQAKNLVQVSVGVYRHKTTGETFTGSDEDSDEEFEEVTVDDVEYVVGQTTKRVYKTSEGPDEFVGYWGVGEFYEASL